MKSSSTTVCAFLFSCRRVFAMVMLVLVFMPALAHAQSYGIATKPAVGPYFDNAFPATPPTVGSFTAVDAYPNLTFINPTGILQVPGQSKMIVWQREGAVYMFDKASTTATKTLVLDISNQCQGWDDAGLMNIVFHPQFDLSDAPGTNRYIYVYYEWVPPGTVVGSPTTRPNNTIPNMRDRISRFELDANGVALAGSEVIIMDQAATNTWHNGSGMFFHPVNGFLYWSNGDDTNSANAQSITGPLLGGVFRVDVDKRGGNVSHAPIRVPTGVTTQNYFIPNNNPFVGQSGVNEETFAIGLRSPHRMTHDAVTGRTYIADVGAGDREEVDIIEPTETSGVNFQWPQKEGYNGDMTPPYIGVNKRPVLDYTHSEGSAIIGGYVYRGAAFPELQGKYLFADNVVNKVWAMNEGTTPATKTLLTTVPTGPGPDSGRSYIGISSWGVDSDGEVYICRLSSTEGKILKLERGSAPSTPLPATLSATGLLSDVANFVPSDKLIPYSINAPFWSDKAIKSRWLTVPTGSTIGFNATGDWSFPAGSIAMKHFDLATDETNPAVRKRLETRVLVKMASGGSYGATYRWRADNSDADLINEGVTEVVPITIPSVGTFTPTDIGNPGVAGSTTVNGNTLTLTGGGSDIWGTSDQFHFAHQQRTGDFDISMKATSFTPAVLYSKFGLMARESLAANSPHYFIFAWASNAGRGANTSGYEDHYRTTAGGNTTATYPAAGTHLVSYPNGWLRMARKGNTFISYTSADGANWVEYSRRTIVMPATLYFGIAMNAHDNGLAATGTIELQTTRLQPWYFPGRTDCVTCHTNNAGGGFIGPNTRQFNKDHAYTATGVTDNQLRAFNHVGMFNTTLNEATIPTYEKLAHVNQTSESLEKRARSYIDTNCANCHRPGGVPALWDARYDTPLANQGIIYGSVGTTLGLVNPRVIVPQSTSRSMMHHRIDRVGANQMPPIGRNLVDEVGVQLITDWINSIPANDPPVVVLTSPTNGANVITPNPVALEATATDADGIVRVEFYDGATKVSEDTTAPYTFSYSDITQGTHTLFARAYDGVNNSADSAGVTINVTELPGLVRAKINFQTAAAAVPSGYVADSGLPYAARGNGMTYGWSRDNTADARERNANADKRYDTLVHMQKDHGGGDVTSSWSIALPNSTYSVHIVTGDATATDGVQSVTANGVALTTGLPAGQNFYEATATVTVTNGLLTIAPGAGAANAKLCYVDISELAPDNGNQLPVIALTGVSPEFPTVGANANLSATASDSDGTITKVEFYANGLKIGEDTTAPYVFSWTGYTAGTYHITARAVDDDGDGATTSSAVVVSVFSPGQPGLYAQYFNAVDFTSLFLSRVETTLNADWGNAAPVTGMMADNFSTRWRGRLLTRDAGNYTLKFFADDGIRVWVNGSLVIDRWAYDPAAVTANLTLTGNSLHDLRVDHREDGGGARVQMLWSGPGFAEETVPSTNLVTPATSVPSEQLAGTVIGTNGSWNNDPNTTKAAVFDGNLNTYYDALEGNGAWAGLDLGEGNSRIITEVRYAPRQFHEWRMLGGRLQGANNADFSDAVTLHTVAEQPPTAGVLTSHLITNNTAFRYVRYLSPNNGFCNVAEVVFLGTTASSPVPLNLAAVAGNAQVALTWLPSAGATGYNVKRATVSGGPYATIASNVLTNTFTDTGLTNGITYHYVVSALSSGGESADSSPASATPFTPVPAGFTATAGNAQVVLSWNSVSGATGYELKRGSAPTGPFTTIATNVAGTGHTDTSAANFTLYYYVIQTLHPSGNSADSAAVSAVPLPPKLTGTIIGTTGSWNNDPNSTRAAVFDGNLNTFFDALEANGAWAGLDLGAGASKRIAAIRYAPRAAWAAGRMTGGRFQGANSADFSDAVTLHTIVGAPAEGVLTLQLVNNATAFRYVRYLSPDNGFCNVAEVEFYGTDVAPTNQLPIFYKGADQVVPLGVTTPQVITDWATGIDDGDPAVTQELTFNITVTSGASIFSTLPTVDSTGTLSYTLTGVGGTAMIDISLTDDALAGGEALTTGVQSFVISQTASTNADLGALSLSAGNLSPDFAASTTGYTADVPFATTSISVTPTSGDGFSTIKVNVNGDDYTSVVSGSPSPSLPLNTGTNTILMKVTAQDGSTVKIYTLTVTRAHSTRPDLTALTLSSGSLSPGFNPDVLGYTVNLPNPVLQLSVTPIAEAPTATITVNGNTTASGAASAPITLAEGANPITIDVTVPNSGTKIYTLTASRSGVVITDQADTGVENDLLTQALDVSGTPNGVLAFTVATLPSKGTVNIDEAGTYRYMPDTDFCGADSFTYDVTDDGIYVGTGTVTIVVQRRVVHWSYEGGSQLPKTKRTAATPGARGDMATWSDETNNKLYVFGGIGMTSTAGPGALNDFWVCDLTTQTWTLIGGSDALDTPATGSTYPGARAGASTWRDASGSLYLFGGLSKTGPLNDLWKFTFTTPTSGTWALVKGTSAVKGLGVYGAQGSVAAGNIPGARSGAATWVDTKGNLWLFGGNSMGETGTAITLMNDLWKYDGSNWTWISGSKVANAAGVYGVKGVASATNIPGARSDTTAWTGVDGMLWLFGGSNNNDLWKYNPDNNTWAWISGQPKPAAKGVYIARGISDRVSEPASRSGACGWVDKDGALNFFGGIGAGLRDDVWSYQPLTGMWTWVKGSYVAAAKPVYGPLHVGSESVTPGARQKVAIAVDANGDTWSFGGLNGANNFNDLFKLDVAPTLVLITGASSSVSDTEQTLSATVNPGELETTAHIRYGTLLDMSNAVSTADVAVGGGTADVLLSESVTGLTPGTTYYYQVVATNAYGLRTGAVRSFTTSGDTPAITVQFATDTSSAAESAGVANVTFMLSAPATSTLTVPVTVIGGSASSGADYTAPDGTVTFYSGQSAANLSIPIINDTIADAGEVIVLGFGTPAGGVSLGTNTVHTLTIDDDDTPIAISTQPASQFVPLKGTLVLSVQATGAAELKYQWKLNGKAIKGATNASFIVQGVTTAAAGAYVCEVSYGTAASIVPSSAAQVFVIDNAPKQFVIAIGKTATFTAAATAPAGVVLSYEWRKAGNPTVLGTAKTYTTPPVSGGDADRYVCTVKGGTPSVSGLSGENLLRPSTAVALYPVQTVGSYLGIIGRGKTVVGDLGGRLDLTTSSVGAFSAKLTSDGVAATVKGTLVPIFTGANVTAASGRADFTRTGKSTLRLDFTLDFTTGTATSNTLSGTLTDLVAVTNGTTEASTALTGYRNVWSKTTKPAAGYVNPYNYLLEIPLSVTGDLDVPQGNGFGSFTVGVDGKVAVAGQIADGLAYTSAGFIGPDVAANAPVKLHIYSVFKTPGGSLIGTGTITPGVHSTFGGTLSWNRRAEAATSKGVTYRAGFAPHDLSIVGGAYTAPAAGEVIGGLDDLNNLSDNARLVFSKGGLTDADMDGSDVNTTADDFLFSISNTGSALAQKITLPLATDTLKNYNKITFKLATAPAGMFNGTITVPSTIPALVRTGKFNGIMVKTGMNTWERAGYFLIAQPPQSGQTVSTSAVLSGQVLLEDPTP